MLPARYTYNQEVDDTWFLEGASIFYDKSGNRYLSITAPELQIDTPKTIEFYKGTITRYDVSFFQSSFRANHNVSNDKAVYLEDNDLICLTDQSVISTYQSVVNEGMEFAYKIEAIYQFAGSIEPKWDGRNDVVPVILENMHGGCVEHTRVLTAFLRLLGVPTRITCTGVNDSVDFTIDHTYAESWIEGCGWVPIESFAASLYPAGTLNSKAMIFGALDSTNGWIIHRGLAGCYPERVNESKFADMSVNYYTE